MIKRIIFHIGLLILFTALQTTWLHELPVVPGLLVIFALLATLFDGPVAGGIYGLVCGLLLDTFSAGPAFLNMLLLLYITVVMGMVSQRVISRTPANAILLTTVFTAVYYCVYYFFSLVIWGEGFSFLNFIWHFFLYVLFCGISTALLYMPIRWTFRHNRIS